MNSTHLKIGIDVDGVLANFTEQYARVINKLVPGTIPDGYEPKDWDWTDILSPELADRAWETIDSTPNFWLWLNGYYENLRDLRHFLETKPDVEIYYVTARKEVAGLPLLVQCHKWLARHLVVNPNTSIIPVVRASYKGSVYKALGVHMSIDDSWTNVANQIASYPEGQHFLLDRSWNRGKEYKKRVFSLQEFLDRAREWQK